MENKYAKRDLDYEKIIENMINGVKSYCNCNGIKAIVNGLSGGIDSSVSSAIVKLSGIKLIGVSLPCSTNEECENKSARMVGEEFCDEFRVVNLQPIFEQMENFCDNASGINGTSISKGNIKARLRMITLYDIASKVKGVVLDNSMITESMLGFYTLCGDVGNIGLLGGLWKHEVYELAKYLLATRYPASNALKASIELVPTDGNGVKAGGDLAQIAPGRTYDDVDDILMSYVELCDQLHRGCIDPNIEKNLFKPLYEKYGEETVDMVISRHLKSAFKRAHLPFTIDLNNGNILEKNGNVWIDFSKIKN